METLGAGDGGERRIGVVETQMHESGFNQFQSELVLAAQKTARKGLYKGE